VHVLPQQVRLDGHRLDGVLGHLGVNVPDLGAARAYYDALLPLLDFEPFLAVDDQVAYRPAGGKRGTYLFLYPALEPGPYSRHHPGLQHLAFMVPTRSAVHAVHDHVHAHGGEVLHEPRPWPEYPPPYFATFWLDPFGVMLEAVCHHDRD
jgi:catechol 2,3-dioxygenase-like lactoylglutathione lyase family enzyme